MIMRWISLMVALLISTQIWSFPCIYTLVKENCWKDYDVSVDVKDADLKTLFTVNIPKGKIWARHEFSCSPAQGLIYVAKFSPTFWESDKNKTYPALRSWSLPGQVNEGEAAWTIPVCFSADFSQVPFPPTAKGTCSCDFKSIPGPKIK
jgi:hypothetical protein